MMSSLQLDALECFGVCDLAFSSCLILSEFKIIESQGSITSLPANHTFHVELPLITSSTCGSTTLHLDLLEP